MKTLLFITKLVLLIVPFIFLSCESESGVGPIVPEFHFSEALSSSTQETKTFLESGSASTNAKLVFVKYTQDRQHLCYIDFSENNDTPVVHTILQAENARVPVISPDGKWVAYAVGEGAETGSPVAKRSSVYICKISETATPVLVVADSACEPRFMQNSTALAIIYGTLAQNEAWAGPGKTMKVEIDGSSQTPKVGEPKVLFESGSYLGGLSWDNKYLCAGGINIAMIDITSGEQDPTIVSLFDQSCNASISSSRLYTNTMMHLTTNGSDPSINDNTPWNTWQVIIINDSEKNLTKGYWFPTTYKHPLQTNPESFTEGKARWHHCEWSNHPYFATATLNADRFFDVNGEWQTTNYQERIYLINLKDSTYLEVLRFKDIAYSGVSGDNSGFFWPGLWVEIPTGFEEEDAWLTF